MSPSGLGNIEVDRMLNLKNCSGNNSKKLLDKSSELASVAPVSTIPVVKTLSTLKAVVDGCFGMELDPDYQTLIDNFSYDFQVLSEYAASVLDQKCEPNWKTHLITAHLATFIDRSGVSLGRFAEQTSEACHAAFKSTQKRYCVSEKNNKFGEKQLRAVVDFSSSNL